MPLSRGMSQSQDPPGMLSINSPIWCKIRCFIAIVVYSLPVHLILILLLPLFPFAMTQRALIPPHSETASRFVLLVSPSNHVKVPTKQLQLDGGN